jgi:X-X-X-Leu-X-X-Gly heptad repeat protein
MVNSKNLNYIEEIGISLGRFSIGCFEVLDGVYSSEKYTQPVDRFLYTVDYSVIALCTISKHWVSDDQQLADKLGRLTSGVIDLKTQTI